MSISYSAGPCSVPLLEQTIGERFRETAERFGDREALVVSHQGYRATYAQLWEQVDVAARALAARGIQPGDRVGIWARNRSEWVVTQLATARIGAILVTLNPAYEAPEAAFALAKAGVSLLVAAPDMPRADVATIVLDRDWEPFLAAAGAAAIDPDLRPDDPINIQFTSGTTGPPKGATLSHRNILNNAFFTGALLGYDERDRVCVPVPLFHCFGMVLGTLACLARGACMVLPSERFDAGAALAAVEAERCTSLYGVPTMFIAELAHPDFERYELSSLRTGAMGGAPCPVDVLRRVRERMHMGEVAIVCGMTETAPLSTQTAPDDPLDKRVSTVGRVHPHVEVKVVDPATGEMVPRGTPGEQCTRGYGVMLGYWDDEAATRAAIDADGWMHTGDLAVLDDDGYVSIVGRIKDIVIRGGENIYPREIEEVLHMLPEVAEAHVIGVPSERYGEELMAWVKLHDGVRADADQLRANLEGRIARYKIPRHWRIVDAFPMTLSGKVKKYRLRELAQAG
jgi:fatty-acyl-CoA synthase